MKKLLNQIKEKLFNKFALILYGIAIVLSIIYGLVYGPFYVHFIDGITIMGMLYFMIAAVIWGQKGKIIDKRSIQLKRFKHNEMLETDNDSDNYTYFKEKNKFIYPSLLLLLIAFLLAAFY